MNLSWRDVGAGLLILVTSPIWTPAFVIGFIAKIFVIGLRWGYNLIGQE